MTSSLLVYRLVHVLVIVMVARKRGSIPRQRVSPFTCPFWILILFDALANFLVERIMICQNNVYIGTWYRYPILL